VNISEKLPEARMNNTESSAIERLIEHTPGLTDKEALNDARRRFASYLRVFGNFFQISTGKLHSGAVQHCAVRWMRFSVAIPSMAFV
jgi:hypothetical protein